MLPTMYQFIWLSGFRRQVMAKAHFDFGKVSWKKRFVSHKTPQFYKNMNEITKLWKLPKKLQKYEWNNIVYTIHIYM